MSVPHRAAFVARVREPILLAFAAGVIAFTLQTIWAREYYGASVPFGDEWDGLVQFLASVRAGDLSWRLMFEPHMEHRIPVARMFFLLVYWTFHQTSFLGLLVISAALMGAIVAVWVYAVRRLGEPMWLIVATVFVLLSRSQYHNMLWAFQVEFYTLVLPVVAAAAWIALAPTITWAGVVGCAAACAICLYSIASGVASWGVVGLLLFLRAYMDNPSLGALLRARRAWLQMALFVALGVLVTAAYFWGYDARHPMAQTASNVEQFLTWFTASIVYPLVDVHLPWEVWWLPVIFSLMFAPILVALWLYWRARDRARLLLVTGVLLYAVTSMALIAFGRGAAPFIAPRYGTIALWTSVASLMSIATLLRASKGTRWQWMAWPPLIALAVAMIAAHSWRYQTYTAEMKEWKRTRPLFARDVLAYVIDGSPQRRFTTFTGYPASAVQPYLDEREIVAVLPYNLHPPARFVTSGDAWSLDGVPGGLPLLPDDFTFGSWSGDDAHTGTLTSTPFHVEGKLVLLVAGHPNRGGNSLAIEAPDASGRMVFPGPDPGEAWTEWRVDASHLPARRVRIVATDASRDAGGWLAVALPATKPMTVRWLEAFVGRVEWLTTPVAAALLFMWMAAARKSA